MRQLLVLLVAAPLLLAAGCLDSTGPGVFQEVPIEEVDFDPSLGIDLADFTPLPVGIWIREDVEGAGDTIGLGQQAAFHYTGWVYTGFLFDRAEEQDGPPPEILLGSAGPLGGLTQGVRGMRLGEVRTVLVPPQLGFGAVNFPGVPPNSWLVLRIRLMAIDGQTEVPDAGGAG
jgi:hypothetical protein